MTRLVLLALLLPFSAFAQTITVSPIMGKGVVIPVIDYTVPTGGSCVLSGGSLSGTQSASGSVTLSPVSAAAGSSITVVYQSVCTGPSSSMKTGDATLTWTAPSKNTDGSTLTDLASYAIYKGPSPAALTQYKTVDAAVTSFVETGLPVGITYFAVTAINAAGIASDMSNIASKTIVGVTTPGSVTTATATMVVSPASIPAAPSGLVVTQPIAYEMRQLKLQRRAVAVGTIAVGTDCGEKISSRWHAVDANHVTITKTYRGGQLVARCG